MAAPLALPVQFGFAKLRQTRQHHDAPSRRVMRYLSPSRPRPPSSRSARRLFFVLWILALGIYAWTLGSRLGAHAAGSDSSGYLNQARLLERGEVATAPRSLDGVPPHEAAPFLYVPLGFRPVSFDPPAMAPTYPTGLSLLVLAAAKLAGWANAPNWIAALHGLAGVLVTYALGRCVGLTPRWSTLAAAMIAVSPLFIFMGLQAMSDVPALVWATLAIVCAETSRRSSIGWAVAAGAAFGLAVLLRPTNALMLVPLAIAFQQAWRRWLAWVLGGLPAALFLAWYQHAAYGAIFTTGYSGITSAFKPGLFWPTLVHYAKWLPLLFSPLVVLIVALPWVPTHQRRTALLLGTWFVLLAGCYAFYDHTHETWWYLRFLLPAAPALIVAALLVAQAWLAGRRWSEAVRTVAFTVALLALIIFGAWQTKRLHAHHVGLQERLYPMACDWARRNFPPEAMVLAMQVTGALQYHTTFGFVRWDHASAGDAARIRAACEREGRPLYAILFAFEETDALNAWSPEAWDKIGQVDQVSFWQYRAR